MVDALHPFRKLYILPLVLVSRCGDPSSVVVANDEGGGGAALDVITPCWVTGEQPAGCRLSKR